MRDGTPLGDVVLIITSEFDPHADVAVQRLTQRGVQVVRWHTADFPAESGASFWINDSQDIDGVLDTGHRHVKLSEVRSVWYRRPLPPSLPETFDPFWVDFATAQANHFSYGLWHSLQCFWISSPAAIRVAELKINQLTQAKRLGFVIPHTLITNDVDEARSFCQLHSRGSVVYKPLRVPPVVTVIGDVDGPECDHTVPMLYTTPLHEEHLANLDSIKWAPGIFQEYVPKAFELRITVVAGRIFPVAIHSQDHPQTIHDWRRYPDDPRAVSHVPHALPSALDTRIRLLIDTLGLNFGAIDMIVRPDGEYVFLEINPNGQFLWIEDLTGLPIMESLVQALVDARSLPR
jgi:glutathione synthase/RimK-type ligase-like ATP-grasp enzyme